MTNIHKRFISGLSTLLIIPALIFSIPLMADDDLVIIEVNNEKLSLSGFNKYYEFAIRILAVQQGISYDDQPEDRIASLRKQYLNQRSTEMVLLQQAAHLNIAPTEDDIEAEVISYYAFAGGKEELLAIAEKSGITVESELRRIITEKLLVRLATARIQDEIVINPGDVVVMHHDIQDQLSMPEQTCIQQILVGSQRDADTLMSRLVNDSDFELIASEYTLAAGNATGENNVSCFAKERLLPGSDFEKAVFSTAIGKVAGPVKSVLGYHIIKVVERKPAYMPGLNEVYAQLEQDLRHERLPARIAEIVESSSVTVYPERLN